VFYWNILKKMKLFLKALPLCPDQITIATTLLSSRALFHSSFAPNALKDCAENLFAGQEHGLSLGIIDLLLHAGTIEFTPRIALPQFDSDMIELDDDNDNIKAFLLCKKIFERLSSTRYSCRSLKQIDNVELTEANTRDFIQNHCEVLESIEGQSRLPEDGFKFFTQIKAASNLRTLVVTLFSGLDENLIFTNVLRHLPSLEMLKIWSYTRQHLLSDEEFLELAHLRHLRELHLSHIRGLKGKTFGQVLEQLPVLTSFNICMCDDVEDYSEICVISEQLEEIAIDNIFGLKEWSKCSFPRLKRFYLYLWDRVPAESIFETLEFLKSSARSLEDFDGGFTFTPQHVNNNNNDENDDVEVDDKNPNDMFLDFFKHHTQLKTFRASVEFSDRGLRSLKSSRNLTELDLQTLKNISPDGLFDFFDSSFPNLKTINFAHIRIGDGNWVAFSKLKNLEKFWVTSAEFSVSREVFDATIFETQVLKDLGISFKNSELDRFPHVNFLRRNTGIKNLYLDRTREPSKIDLTALLPSASVIQNLSLKIVVLETAIVDEILSKARHLFHFEVRNDVTDAMIQILADNKFLRNTLQSLRFFDCRLLSRQAYPALKTIINTPVFVTVDAYEGNGWSPDELMELVDEEYRGKKTFNGQM
jgi:hypothetical protein